MRQLQPLASRAGSLWERIADIFLKHEIRKSFCFLCVELGFNELEVGWEVLFCFALVEIKQI